MAIITASTCCSMFAQDKAALQANATVVSLLQGSTGKSVELHLRSGVLASGIRPFAYLHNASVRIMHDLVTPVRGGCDALPSPLACVRRKCDGLQRRKAYVLETSASGNSIPGTLTKQHWPRRKSAISSNTPRHSSNAGCAASAPHGPRYLCNEFWIAT
jgi:hypothetical protein